MTDVHAGVDGAPGTAGAERVAVAFARLLRAAGLEIAVGSTVLFAEALAVVGLARRDAVYWAGRATLLHRPEDAAVYDRAFRVFWERARAIDDDPGDDVLQEIVLAVDAEDGTTSDEDDGVGSDVPVITLRWSPHEVLRTRDFAAYSEAEFAEARRLMADLRLSGALKRSRRLRRSRATRATRGARPDLRRTVRRSLTRGGEPVTRAYLEPSTRPRRIVLLLDVSGSMEPYARAFVRFLHAAVAGRSRVEAFALGTRLTRVTRELQTRDPDAAIAAAARRVADWSGGTRLGEGVRRFNDEWGVRGMARGAIVVILSDGWDRGDPQLLASELARLHRVAFRIVWVNPLKATAGYAPLAQGMAAALPHVDEFVEGHSLQALEELAAIIGR